MNSTEIHLEDLSDLTKIGRGAAATVHRCTTRDGRDAALKLFNAVAADDPAAEQFRRERDALERLPRHPAIIGLEGRGRAADGRPFLLLELTDRTLRDRVDEQGPLPWAEATVMALAIAGALETAHRGGVWHCDVAPANVHQVDDGWKLADFGAACDGRADADPVPAPFTLDHAAPEAIRGEDGAAARDVYGLASTLFHALAGEAPFGEVRHQPGADIAERIAQEPAPDLRPMGVPDALCQVIERALSKDPELRPPTAGALAQELAAAAEPLGLRVTPPLVLTPVTPDLTAVPPVGPGRPDPEPPAPAGRRPGRLAPMLVGAAAAALAVGAAIPVVTDAIDDGPDSLVIAEQPAEVALGADDEAVPADADGAATGVAVPDDGAAVDGPPGPLAGTGGGGDGPPGAGPAGGGNRPPAPAPDGGGGNGGGGAPGGGNGGGGGPGGPGGGGGNGGPGGGAGNGGGNGGGAN